MKNVKIIIILFTLLINCSIQNGYSQNIVGGDEIEITEVPWQISLEKDLSHVCGGIIIDPEWILTAAHCVDDWPMFAPGCFIVHAGSKDQTNNGIGQRIQVDRIIRHPDHNPVSKENDLALLHLKTPLTLGSSVQTIGFGGVFPGEEVYISGWGDDGSGSPTALLKGGEITVITETESLQIMSVCSSSSDLTGSMLSLYDEDISGGEGDSGGPAVKNKDTNPILVGVASWLPCDNYDNPTIYTNVIPYLSFINSTINSDPDLTVSSNLELKNEYLYLRDVEVMPGNTLTIEDSDIFFAEDAEIFLHKNSTLILDEARLSSECNTWKGIVSDNAVIKVLSQKTSSISNAEIGVEMLKDSELEVVLGNSVADPVLHFQDCLTNGIRGIDIEKLILHEANFDNCDQGIILTFPTGNIDESTNISIDNCDFSNNNEDLKIVSGSGMENIPITNNSFSGIIGLNLNGDNAFIVRNNIFHVQSIWSSLLYSTGNSNDNLQNLNDISSQSFGIVAVGDNRGYQFETNCFIGNGDADVIINGDFSNQGDLDEANSNCFSQDGLADIQSYSTNQFNYWEPKQNLGFNTCVYSTTNTPNGYNSIQDSDEGLDSHCNIVGGNNNTNGNNYHDCVANYNPTDITNLINGIDAILSSMSQSQYSSLAAMESEATTLNRCLIKLHNQLASYYVENNQINDAVNVYSNHSLFDMQIKGYFILINEGQYVNARNYLISLPATTTEQTEFVQSSVLYLDALEQGTSYVLSQTNEAVLYQAALKTYPLAGYSRSIWMHFKGEDIRMNVTLPTGQTAPRSKSILGSVATSKVNPNPADVELLYQVKGLEEKTFGFEIFDITGKIITRMTNLKESYRLNTVSYSTGIYVCRVFDDQGKVINVHKVYIQ